MVFPTQIIWLAGGFCLGIMCMVAMTRHDFATTVSRQHFGRRADSKSSDILKFGNPGPIHDVLDRLSYVASYNRRDRVPDWVGEHLTADSLVAGQGVDRGKSNFQEDTAIPEMFRAHLADYTRSGYDRGHMAPAADAVTSQEALDETFLLTNMAPQVGIGFNRHYWSYVEGFVRDLTKSYSDVYVYTGPIFLPKSSALVNAKDVTAASFVMQYPVLGKTPNVAVPTHFFKIILATMDESTFHMASFLLPNQAIDRNTPLKEFHVNLTSIEKASGLQFFNALDRTAFIDLCTQIKCEI